MSPLYLSLNVTLGLIALISTFCSKKLDRVFSFVAFLLIFGFSYFRELSLPDDLNYFKAFKSISDDFNGSPLKYGIFFKIFAHFLMSIGINSVQAAFSIIILAFFLTAFKGKFSRVSPIFVLLFFCFQVVMLIQMRQSLALVLAFAAILCWSKSTWLSVCLLISSALAHQTHLPFVFVVLLSLTVFRHCAPLMTLGFTLMFCVGVFTTLAILPVADVVKEAFNTYPILTHFTSLEALFFGHVGLGGSFWYLILLAVSIYLAVIKKEPESKRILLNASIIGTVIFPLAAYIPLTQRFVLPFYLYMIVFLMKSHHRKLTATLVFIGLVLSISRAPYFEEWIFCLNCQESATN